MDNLLNEYQIAPKYQGILKQFMNKKQLDNIEFFYQGFHNVTFKAIFNGQTVQLRIPSNDFVNWENENKVFSQLEDVLYYNEGILIKKWYEGKTLDKVRVTTEIQQKVIEKVKQFHTKNIDVAAFDWDVYHIEDPKYKRLVKKYQDQTLVTSHGDLALKNILLTNNNEIVLLDFEWVRKCNEAFDVLSLYQNGFDKELLKESFGMSEEYFTDFEYLCEQFRFYAYKQTYVNLLQNNVNLKQIKGGLTNESYVLNDKFIQFKKYNGYNHLNNHMIFNNQPWNVSVVYEDDKIVVRDFIKNTIFEISSPTILKKIALALKQMHYSNINVEHNNVSDRVETWFHEYHYHPKIEELDENLKKKLLENFHLLDSNVVSHNDLNPLNIIYTKDEIIKFIDLEYVCFNTKYFDLAYFSSNAFLTDEQEKYLLSCYEEVTDWSEYYRLKCLVNFYGLLWSLDINDEFNLCVNINNINKYKEYLK
ncbi:phosphotransferase [Mycoplasma sp. 3341]|uniref:phosphotransferase n=1 Tax=Mycoplasma sp. 3341 TaxID=3447506 RepID=UPI003F6581F6